MSGADLNHRVSLLEAAVSEIRDAVKSIDESLKTLAILEERHAETRRALDRAFGTIEKLEARVLAIEVVLPGLKEIRAWVVGGVLSTVGLVGAALLAMVIVK